MVRRPMGRTVRSATLISERLAIVGLIAAGVLCTFLCGTVAVAQEEIGNDTCLGCHGAEGFDDGQGRSLFVGAEALAASVHAGFSCNTCHTDAKSVPHEKLQRVPLDICAGCHTEQVSEYRESVHGKARAQGATDAATCRDCHDSPHVARKTSDPTSAVYPLLLPHTCGVCHGNADLAKRHNIPVVNAYEMFLDSIHGRALTKSGLLVSANCSSCHGSHGIRAKKDPSSRVARTNIPATCGGCHAGITEKYAKSIHGREQAEGNLKAPVCTDCHSAHQIARTENNPWKLEIIHECGTCHEESLKTYRDTFHGQVTNLGFTSVARCSDCHGAHDVLPASDPASSISPQRRAMTCRKCHPRANDNFANYAPHADPEDPDKNPLLYWIATVMGLLIVGVFLFFGLHTILWFVRSMFEVPKRSHKNGKEH